MPRLTRRAMAGSLVALTLPGPQRVAAARGVYAVQPLDDAIIAQQQAIADTFTGLHIIPARIDIRSAVWRSAVWRSAVWRSAVWRSAVWQPTRQQAVVP